MNKKILNSVCFIRKYCHDNSEYGFGERMFCLKEQIKYNNEYNVKASYLFEYDALVDADYVATVKQGAKDGDEMGLWLEIVEPLVKDAGLAWRGREGWLWDYHVCPGFIMAYTGEEKKRILDTAMKTFHDTFGHYPETVGSWLIDSESMRYMSETYHTDAFIICREQWGMDGYSLWGGPYYGAYYPNKNNMQTPAQSIENQTNTPVFRMFINDPIYCYYEYAGEKYNGYDYNLFTQEPFWKCGQNPEWVKWQYDNIFSDATDDFTFIQLGQENAFDWHGGVEKGLPMQMEFVKETAEKYGFENLTVGEMGRRFKALYKTTPQKAVGALEDWAGNGQKSVWFNNKHYRVNVFSDKKEVWIRDIHVFCDDYRDKYLDTPCTTHTALYDNPPIVDGIRFTDDSVKAGFFFGDGEITYYGNKDGVFTVELVANGEKIVMKHFENTIEMTSDAEFSVEFRHKEPLEFITSATENKLCYTHGGVDYALDILTGCFDGKAFHSKEGKLSFAL